MFKKIAVGLLAAVMLLGGSFTYVEAQNVSLSQLVDLFISLGIIAPEKAAAARAAVSSSATNAVVPSTTSIGSSASAPLVAVVGSPTITKSLSRSGDISTSTVTAVFNLKIDAIGGDYTFLLPSAGGSVSFSILSNGLRVSPDVARSASYTMPSSGVVTSGLPSGQFKLQQGNSITLPVSYSFEDRQKNGVLVPTGAYAVQIDSVGYRPSSGGSGGTSVTGNAKTNTVYLEGGPAIPAVVATSYHSADTDKDWKISEAELTYFTTLYNYRANNVRTGEYGILAGSQFDGITSANYIYVPGRTAIIGPYHSADSNKDWRISSTELSRVISFKNSAGYKIQSGTEDGYAPIPLSSANCSAVIINGYSVPSKNNGESITVYQTSSVSNGSRIAYTTFTCSNGNFTAGPEVANITCNAGYASVGLQCLVAATSSHHSADTDKDWKISEAELTYFTNLFNYRSGTVRTGDYSVSASSGVLQMIVYVPGPNGLRSHVHHSADSNKDWKISLSELTRVIEFKNSAGYRVQAGTEDGYAPIPLTTSSPSITVLSPNGGELYKTGETRTVSWNIINGTSNYSVGLQLSYIRNGVVYEDVIASNLPVEKERQSYSWEIPAKYGEAGMNVGSFKIRALLYGASQVIQDYSDSVFSIASSQTQSCTDSDGGVNINVAGLTDGRVNGIGSYFNDSSVGSNGGSCSGTSCTGVAEGYCSNGAVTNYVYQCPSGYSVNGACATKPVTNPVTSAYISLSSYCVVPGTNVTVTAYVSGDGVTSRVLEKDTNRDGVYGQAASWGAGSGTTSFTTTESPSYTGTIDFKLYVNGSVWDTKEVRVNQDCESQPEPEPEPYYEDRGGDDGGYYEEQASNGKWQAAAAFFGIDEVLNLIRSLK